MLEQVEILRMSYGPWAVGKLESGKTCFVKGATPGKTYDVEIFEKKKNLCYGRLVEPCKNIPGAPWAHLSYEVQVEQKKQIIIDALTRVGAQNKEFILKLMPDLKNNPARALNYRNKIELTYRSGTLGMIEEGSDNFYQVDEFELANKLISDAPKKIAGALRFAMHGEDFGLFRVGIRGSENTNSIEIALWTTPGWFPRSEVANILSSAIDATSIVRVIADEGSARRVKQVEVLAGKGRWSEVLQGLKYDVSAPSFFQVNTWGACELQKIVLNYLKLTPDMNLRVADLYSGCGTFTLPIAKSGIDVSAVELAGSSTRDLKRNLENCNLHAKVICDDVLKFMPDMNFVDVAIVDPPKSGLDKRIVSLLSHKTQHVIYVSCDPQTLARDIKRFAELGFEIQKIDAVDMFPQTFHVETIVLLSKIAN